MPSYNPVAALVKVSRTSFCVFSSRPNGRLSLQTALPYREIMRFRSRVRIGSHLRSIWKHSHQIHSSLYAYVRSHIPGTHLASLGALPRRLVWTRRTRHIDELYCESQPLVVFAPAVISFISYQEYEPGVHRLQLDVRPLALFDVVGLYQLTSFALQRTGACLSICW